MRRTAIDRRVAIVLPGLIAILAASASFAQQQPDVAALVRAALGDGVVPYAAVRPLTADFNGDGKPDIAVIVDFNKYLATWLKRGTVILNLDSPTLARMRPDNEQHFCFGLLILEGMEPAQKTIFYGCFTGWRPIPGPKEALNLDMESGSILQLYNDGSRFRTRVVRQN